MTDWLRALCALSKPHDEWGSGSIRPGAVALSCSIAATIGLTIGSWRHALAASLALPREPVRSVDAGQSDSRAVGLRRIGGPKLIRWPLSAPS